jgi:hypothetical protein
MEFRIWVETRLAGRVVERELVAQLERPPAGIGPEEIGLSLEEGKTVLRKVQLASFRRGSMHWERLPCDAAFVDKLSTSRIYEPAVFERCLERFKCPAVVITAACVEAVKRHYLAAPPLASCRERHRSFSTSTRVGAADCLTVEPRRCVGDLLLICTGSVSHATLRRHTQAVGARLDQRVTEPDEYDWPQSRREAVQRPSVSALPSTEPICEPMG